VCCTTLPWESRPPRLSALDALVTFPPPTHRKRYPSQCHACRGHIVEGTVTLTYPDREGKVRVIEGVPAGVCDQCHEQYFTVETSREIDRLLTSPPSRQEEVPVWEFAKAG